MHFPSARADIDAVGRLSADHAPSGRLMLADRLLREGRADEEVERLAQVSLNEILTLRVQQASQGRAR